MTNGEGHWGAIAELRTLGAKHEREVGVLDSRVGALKEDVNGIGKEVRNSRTEIVELVDARVNSLEERFDRTITTFRWVIGLSVPAVCTLLGLLIGKQ